MEVFDSVCRLRHGSTVLVAIGDPCWEIVRVNGRQLVDEVTRVRAAGLKAVPRGNESNEITYTLCEECEDIEAASKAALTYPAALPRTAATITLDFADSSGATYADGVISDWSSDIEGRLVRHRVRIVAGKATAI